MNYDKHLFISYAHLDDEFVPPAQQGWVSKFHARLEKAITFHLGHRASIWLDRRRLAGNDVFSRDGGGRWFVPISIRAAVVSFAVSVLLLPGQIAHAEEPIQEALGQTLGAVFDASTSTKSSGSADEATFSYPAPGQSADLTEFSVIVTPLSYHIFSIRASGEQSGKSHCQDMATVIFGTIAEKYFGKQYGGDMRELKDGGGYFLVQSKTHRRIHVECEQDTGKTKLILAYLDDPTHDLAEKEADELEQLQADFTAKNYQQILPRIQELARQGNLLAETMLGLMYGHGYGVAVDEDAAEDHYLRAAQRGWLNAEFNLGTFYQHRFLYKQAELWLQKAAERGLPEAEENLAQLYIAKGPLNSEEHGFYWFLRAAEHGQRESQYNTCYDYADGLGVKRDMVEAYKWCYIAAQNGQKQADANKDHLAAQMRPEEVARGRQAAELWLAQNRSDNK